MLIVCCSVALLFARELESVVHFPPTLYASAAKKVSRKHFHQDNFLLKLKFLSICLTYIFVQIEQINA